MRCCSDHVVSLLRASVLVLLMLGVVVKPLLGSLCEIHAIGDVVAGLTEVDLAGPEHDNDREHARGAHAELHEDNNAGAYAEIAGVIIVPASPPASANRPPMAAIAVETKPASTPFRPPIA